MKKLLGLLMAIMICLGISFLIAPQDVHAAKQEGDIAGGVCDNVDWRITSAGELIIGDGTEQTFMNRSNRGYNWTAWLSYRTRIKSVRFDGIVHGNGSMAYMFYNCVSLTSFNASGFDTSNVTKMDNMFSYCSALTSIDLSGWDTSNVTSLSNMFFTCESLTSFKASGFDTSNVTSFSYMFWNCKSLTSVDVSDWDTSNATDMSKMFYSCSKLSSIDLAGWDTGNVKNMSEMFHFCGCVTLDVSEWDVSNVETMSSMFTTCKNLEILDVSKWDTHNVTSMAMMFAACDKLKYLDVSNWDTSKVVNMQQMFDSCTLLETLDVSKWNTSNLEDLGAAFWNCFALKELDVSDWDTSKLKGSLSYTFDSLRSVTTLDLSNWNTSNVTSMYMVFQDCSNLETLDLSGFETTNATNMTAMYSDNPNLKKVILGSHNPFIGNSVSATLPTPVSFKDGVYYTRKWISEDGVYGPYTPAELRDNYDPSTMQGAWVWEVRASCNVVYQAPDGAVGSMPNDTLFTHDEYKIPTCQFAIFDHSFLYWDDGQGHQYENKATIPSETYEAGSTITLTAVFEKNDHHVTMQDDGFEFKIHAGETAVFDNIPAGTAYQVYEKTEDGWVLVQQENASGVIDALEESAVAFWNKYQPGVVTAQFTGIKKLDGHPAEAGSYNFELLDSDRNVIQTKTVLDGGFIQFDPIEFTEDDIGEHIYIIREIDPQDDSIDYDVHEETVKVVVKEQGGTKYSHTDNINDAGEKQGDYVSYQNYGDVITIPGAQKLHVTVKYTNPRGYFWIWRGVHDEVHSGTSGFSNEFNNSTAIKNYTYQSGKDQEYLTDEFDVQGDSISLLYYSYAYPQDASNYSDMVNYGYYITVSNETLVADVTYDEDGIAFNNNTRPGTLRITKDATNGTSANANDEFTVEIEFRNESGMPINDDIYWYVEGDASPSDIDGGNQE